jgi:hypothetical protein
VTPLQSDGLLFDFQPRADTIICLDVDGTLTDHQGRIRPEDAEILASDRRASFVLATGRLLPSLRRTFAENNLFADRPIPLPMVLQNGAALYKPGERLEDHYPFPAQTQAALIDAMETHRRIAYLLFSLSEVHMLWPTPLAQEILRRFDLDAQTFDQASRQKRFTKAICVADDPGAVEDFASSIAGLALETSYSIPTVFELTRAGIDKGRGLLTLLDALGLDEASIVTVGDGGNDLPMFDVADLALAPDTSPKAIQERADHVVEATPGGLLTPVLRIAGFKL